MLGRRRLTLQQSSATSSGSDIFSACLIATFRTNVAFQVRCQVCGGIVLATAGSPFSWSMEVSIGKNKIGRYLLTCVFQPPRISPSGRFRIRH
jgi:hypothetical protein